MNLRHTPSPVHIYLPYLEKSHGVIQIGAGDGVGSECRDIPYQIYIEARPTPLPPASENPHVRSFNCAISDYIGEADFYLSSNSQLSSSLFPFVPVEPNDYALAGKTRVQVQTLDNLLAINGLDAKNYDFLFIDVQGAEYNVIKGALPNTLPNIKYVWTEVDFGPNEMYEGIVLFPEFDAFMVSQGFTREYMRDDDPWYWMGLPPRSGEALYVRSGS